MLLTSLQALRINKQPWVSTIDWLNTRIIQYRQPSCSNISQVLNLMHFYLTADGCNLSIVAWSRRQFKDKSCIWATHWFIYVTLWHIYLQNILLVTQTWALFPFFLFPFHFLSFFPSFCAQYRTFRSQKVAKLYNR